MYIKRFVLLFVALLPLFAFAQKAFTITGDVKPFKNGDRIFLSYKENDIQHLDSTIVNNGQFKFAGLISDLGIGYVCRNDNPLKANILYDSINFFIQPGDILITTQDSLKYATIEGTPLNKITQSLNSP